MFFTNVFSYAGRRRLCEHAYQKTRADLRRRLNELRPVMARHGITINEAVLADAHRTLLPRGGKLRRRGAGPLGRAAGELTTTLEHLEALISQARRPPPRRTQRVEAAE